MEIQQKGIKWWKDCPCCGWEGKAIKPDNDNTECPNCGLPELRMNVDERVFNGRRYEHDARSEDKRQDAANVPDTVSRSKRGFKYNPNRPKPIWR